MVGFTFKARFIRKAFLSIPNYFIQCCKYFFYL